MSAELLVVAPVLGRPGRAQALADSLAASTEAAYRLLFVCSHGDDDEIAAVRATGADMLVVPWSPGSGDYARKVNLGFSRGREPWLFQAADDLDFTPGWDVVALDVARRTGVGVIGTNDLGNPRVRRGAASTHSLISRAYIEEHGGAWGEPGRVLHVGYHHNFCDEELVDLAMSRHQFAFARRCYVEHLHPHWGKGDDDPTYRLGQQTFRDDQRLYSQRRVLWRGRSARRPPRVP